MADRLKDKEDLKLESLFRPEAIADDGFSNRVVTRIRRKLLIRRWSLPVAILIGGLIAAKPAAQLLALLPALLAFLPENVRTLPADMVPQVSTLILGAVLAGAMTFFVRVLDD